jgi:predicted dehydrogenase
MTPTKRISSRRDFLKTTAAGAAAATGFLIIPSGWLRGQDAPSNRVNFAAIGLGGQGTTDLRGVLKANASLVALCDVRSDALARAAKAFGNDKVQTFADYRILLDKLGKDLDAVVVSTPDHTHFTIALDSIQRGKHAYVQKPMAHSIDQCHRLTKAAADAKIVSAMGNQGHSSNHIRMIREWFEAGLFGHIPTIDCWTGQYMGPVPKAYRPTAPQPKNLNWDLWLGPAKYRDYFPGVAPGFRPYIEFGSGSLGDMAAHVIDPAFYILDLDAPERVEILERNEFSPVAYAAHAKLAFHFPAKGNRGPVKLVWWHGKNFRPKPPAGLQYQEFNQRKDDPNLPDDPSINLHPGVTGWLGKKNNDGLTLNGSLFYGEKLAFNMGQYGDFFFPAPQSKLAELKENAPPVKYARSKGGHYRAWVNAIRTGGKAISDFDYAGKLNEVICIGNIALRLGRDLRWDAKANKFINDDEANGLIASPKPRAGFHA